MPRPRKYPQELLERGTRLVLESGRPIAHVARDLGVPAESLRKYVRQVEATEGLRPDLPTAAEREEIRVLRKEVFELRRANEILKAASVFFATELDADRTNWRSPSKKKRAVSLSADGPLGSPVLPPLVLDWRVLRRVPRASAGELPRSFRFRRPSRLSPGLRR
jgi:transposase